MAIQRMEHVEIVVDDLAAAIESFAQLGLELHGKGSVEGRWVDRVVGLEGCPGRYRNATNSGRLELTKFNTPSPTGGDKRHRRTHLGSAMLHLPSKTLTPDAD